MNSIPTGQWSTGMCNCCSDGIIQCCSDFICLSCNTKRDFALVMELTSNQRELTGEPGANYSCNDECCINCCSCCNSLICVFTLGLCSLVPLAKLQRRYSQWAYSIAIQPAKDNLSTILWPALSLMQVHRHIRHCNNNNEFKSKPKYQTMEE